MHGGDRLLQFRSKTSLESEIYGNVRELLGERLLFPLFVSYQNRSTSIVYHTENLLASRNFASLDVQKNTLTELAEVADI